jgi:UDP:flavonoid glycosyltransferase YjiC (YdhE family)
MKFLLIPGNNSLSHVAKCVALESELTRRGHTVRIAVSSKHTGFIQQLGLAYSVLPDIQESDGGALPSLNWFRSCEFLADCIQAEIQLIKAFRPDRVIGVFRFTLKVSTSALGVPYDTVACGCMMPDVPEILGYGNGDDGASDQALYLNNFFRFAGRRMAMAMDRFGLATLTDVRDLLMGDRTFLWDYPEFMPLPEMDGRHHVGPISWHRWPQICEPPDPFSDYNHPLALLSLGTRPASRAVVSKAASCLLKCGYNVIVACGGHKAIMGILPEERRLRCWGFAPLGALLGRAQLLVCHGGQMTIFEALRQKVPVLVIPSHPEQAHNGLCLERIKCGARLVPPIAFKGDTQAFADAFLQQPNATIVEKIEQIAADDRLTKGLSQARSQLQRYNAPVRMADLLEMN